MHLLITVGLGPPPRVGLVTFLRQFYANVAENAELVVKVDHPEVVHDFGGKKGREFLRVIKVAGIALWPLWLVINFHGLPW